nr:acyl-coenzyme A amino acid N-acyltransferase 1-like [Lytechinus pictus]
MDLDVESFPRLRVLPECSLNDEDLHIKAVGLRPHQRVTLRAHVYSESRKHRFESHARYEADDRGVVEVEKAPSLGGSYRGIEPMGLLWSLEPAPEDASKRPRLVKLNVQKPFIYTFQLIDDDDENKLMHSTSVERWYLASYVERHLAQHGTADGCLYLPQKKGASDPLPVLLDIRGGVPFLVEDRPSLMASHGFAVFSINYFRKMMEGRVVMHEKCRYFDLQIFLDLFEYIALHPRLDINRVGIVSSCLGSVLALQAAARLKDLIPIRCVAATGCLDFLGYQIGLKLPDGSTIDPYNTADHCEVVEDKDGGFIWQLNDFNAYDNLQGDFLTPVEDITCPLLFITSGDDQQLPSYKRMTAMKDRIEKVGKGHLLESIHLEGTGHYVDAPYLPVCRQNNMDPTLPYPVFSINGGDPRLHAYGLNKAWRKSINWFRCQLNVTETYRLDWLDSNPSVSHLSSKL